MDRLNKLRGDAGASGDSTPDTSTVGSEAYMTANESSSKYFSLTEVDSSFSISPSKGAVSDDGADGKLTDPEGIISNLSPIPKKSELDGFKIGDQIEAANILSGGVNIFDDNENSYDEDELVIDDAVQEGDDKSVELKPTETTELTFDKNERLAETTMDDSEAASPSKDTEVVLQIDGRNVDAIDIGNGLYLYRKDGEEELAAVQILDDDQQQPNIKFLKVRENAEGNLEVYEEIEIEVPKDVPAKEGKAIKNSLHIPVKDVNRVSEAVCTNVAENVTQTPPKDSSLSEAESDLNKDTQIECKTEVNLNGKMMKFSESRKSPLIGTFTPMTYHSTPNKEGIPLTKTMVDLQLHPSRHSENVKKTIEVHTDNCKQRLSEQLTPTKNIKDSYEYSKNLEIMPLDKELSNDMVLIKPVQSEQQSNENNDDINHDAQIEKIPDKNLVTDVRNEKVHVNALENDKSEAKDKGNLENKDKTELCEVDTPSQLANTWDMLDSENKLSIQGVSNKDVNVEGLNLQDKPFTNVDILEKKSNELCSQITDVCVKTENRTDNVGPKNYNEENKECKDVKENSSTVQEKDKNDTEDIFSKTNSNDVAIAGIQETTDINIISNIEVQTEKVKKPLEISSNLTERNMNKELLEYSHADIKMKDACDIKQPDKGPVEVLESLPECNKSSCDEKTQQHSSTPKILLNNSPGDYMEPKEAPNEISSVQMFQNIATDVKRNTNTQSELPLKLTDNSQNLSKASENVLQTQDESAQIIHNFPAAKKKDINVLFKQPEGTINMLSSLPKETAIITAVEVKEHDHDSKITLSKDIKIKNPAESSQNKKEPFNYLDKDFNTKSAEEMKKIENKLKNTLGDNISEDKTIIKNFMELKQSNITNLTKSVIDDVKRAPIIDIKSTQKNTVTEQNYGSNYRPVTKAGPTEKKCESKMDAPVVCEKNSYSLQISQQEVEQIKSDTKKESLKVTIKPVHKPINNNKAAVPFGKWTEANRQEFLNKIKESKVPSNTSNTKQLKQPNDLNRRDVLKKIDSQRQSNIASVKVQELNTINKNETAMFVNKSNVPQKEKGKDNKIAPAILKATGSVPKKTIESKTGQSIIKVDKVQLTPVIAIDMSSTALNTKKDSIQRKEINNQDLIDKTIEGIINRAVTAKFGPDDVKHSAEQSEKSKNPNSFTPVSLDEIESKMNELHGIPFVERPPHELPKVVDYDSKSIVTPDLGSKSNKIPNLVPFIPKPPQKVEQKGSHPIETRVVEESDEEIIEHEPITGDSELNKSNLFAQSPELDKIQPQDLITNKGNIESKKEAFITEKDFDKFARRTSITYENRLTVNFDGKEQNNVIQTVVEKEVVTKKLSRNEIMLAESKAKSNKHLAMRHNNLSSKIPTAVKPANEEDSYNKNYQSKVQIAYQSVMTAKRQQECPITIIEDKPVKVVFMDANSEFIPHQLHVQGKELSPPKKAAVDWDHYTHSNSESMDSDILDTGYDNKSQDDNKFKSKHQRKQIFTPVEAPELELIEPGDLDIEVSPKKKRRIEENKPEKNSKTLPKKSYLLNRNLAIDDTPSNSPDFTKTKPKEPINQQDVYIKHSDTISAIDNLVKAAELLETQSENSHVLPRNEQNSPLSQNNSIKRGRGRPRKYPLPDSRSDNNSPSPVKTPTPQKKPRLIDAKMPKHETESEDDDFSSDGELVKENWTMGKINENIVCPICNKLFRSENVVFKHVKHCTGPSPSRSDSDKRSLGRSRHSQELDWKSEDSQSDSMDIDEDFEINKPMKKRRSKEKSPSVDYNKSDVIVIEDTPVKETLENGEKSNGDSNKTVAQTKFQHKPNNLMCEFCGKTFRQLSYLVNHKLQHKNTEIKKNENEQSHKSLFNCEICKKEFRKLHHLVQHRIFHNPNPMNSRSSRKSSSEQSDSKATRDVSKPSEDQSAGFRCEPCDKSFRKLHHLVEHRETHDEMNKKSNTASTNSLDAVRPTPLHNCDICKKTFKKLQHLIEHKEQHLDTSSEKSDDKSVKSSLSTKDIIHECPLCYMVFPNEHSLNKHTVICQRKKKQSAAKQTKQIDDDDVPEVLDEDEVKVTEADEEKPTFEENTDTRATFVVDNVTATIIEKQEPEIREINQSFEVEEYKEVNVQKEIKTVETDTPLVKLPNSEKDKSTKKKDLLDRSTDKVSAKSRKHVLTSLAPEEIINIPDTPTPKKKLLSKDKIGSTVSKRQKTINPPSPATDCVRKIESNDDDEIRYMLNPDYVHESREENLFMKVRSKKRNSLQIERPNSKDLLKRTNSLQHPPKIPRLKVKPIPRKPVNTNTVVKTTRSISVRPDLVPSTDSDDSDVKYSFPVSMKKEVTKDVEKKVKRQTIGEKRKSLSNIVKRKSLGKTINTKHKVNPSPAKQIKKRTTEVEHRCDCGQLFSSAALLSRHTSLAHTPPRIRRRRSPPPEPHPQPTKPANKRIEKPAQGRRKSNKIGAATKGPGVATRKSSLNTDAKTTSDARKTSKSMTVVETRRSAPHRGEPVTEKMKKLMDKSKK